jgi:hypothetical protein
MTLTHAPHVDDHDPFNTNSPSMHTHVCGHRNVFFPPTTEQVLCGSCLSDLLPPDLRLPAEHDDAPHVGDDPHAQGHERATEPTWEELLGDAPVQQEEVRRQRPEKVIDPDLRASRIREGRYGLTRAEGRRRAEFRKSEDLVGPVPYEGEPAARWSQRVHGFLVGLALRAMRVENITPGPQGPTRTQEPDEATREALEDAVRSMADPFAEAYVTQYRTNSGMWVAARNSRWTTLEEPRRYKTTSAELTYQEWDRAIEKAVARAWVRWDDDYMKNKSEAGRRGGTISTHGSRFTPEMLDDILHFSKSKQAARLGCSVSTIRNLRAQHAYYSSFNK